MTEELQAFVSSKEQRSITRYINSITKEVVISPFVKKDVKLVDTPGFGDTQGAEVDISNTLGIIQSVSKCSEVYPVFLFSIKSSGDRSELLKRQIESYSCMF